MSSNMFLFLLLFYVFTNRISLTSKLPRSPRRKPCTRTQDVSWENPLGEEKPSNLSLSSSIHEHHVMPLAIVEGEGVALVQEHRTNKNVNQKNSARTKNKVC